MRFYRPNNQSFSRPPLRLKRQKYSDKETTLAEWNKEQPKSWEKENIHDLKSIKSLVDDVTKKFNLEKKLAQSEIRLVWKEVVDPVVQEHSHPTGMKNGTLFVSVDSQVWLDEIVRFRRKEILKALQSAFSASEISRISFRCGG